MKHHKERDVHALTDMGGRCGTYSQEVVPTEQGNSRERANCSLKMLWPKQKTESTEHCEQRH